MPKKLCAVCGKEFYLQSNKFDIIKCCSRECGKELYFQSFIDKFNTLYAGSFGYVSGYVGSEDKFVCACIKCGKEKEVTAQCIRQGHKRLHCFNCDNIERDRQRLLCMRERIISKSKQIKYSIYKKRIACDECGKEFYMGKGKYKYCSKACQNKRYNRLHELNRRNKLKQNGTVDNNITIDKLMIRDNGICYICGKDCDKNDFTINNDAFITGKGYPTIDHVIPVSKGGTHTWDNVKLSHMKCNSQKRDKSLFGIKDGQVYMIV